MSTRRSYWLRLVVVVGLLVAVGACAAAVNWYGIWTSFAHLDVESRGGSTSLSTVDSQAKFQRWVLVALVSLVVATVVMASDRLTQSHLGGVVKAHPLKAATR
jgi:hypothetical protein